MTALHCRRLARAGIVSALLLLGGCGGGAELPPLESNAVILAFGDSLTFGSGAGRDESYPAVLAALTGRKVVNSGVPGEISANGLKRLPGELDRHRPALLILCHGGNDFLRKMPVDQTAANIEAMIALASARGIPVVLLGVPRPGLFLSADALYQEAADRSGAAYLDFSIAEVLSEPGLKSDMVHPNKDGYRVLAGDIHGLLQDAGAL